MNSLIAREQYVDILMSTVDKAVLGSLQASFITGEAGIGKTTLLNYFLEIAKSRYPGLIIIGGKCHNLSGGYQEPFLPFVQILSSLSSKKYKNWERLRRGVVELAPDWIQIIPGGDLVAAIIKTAQWTGKEISGGEDIKNNKRYMIQFVNFFTEIAKETPLLIWLDDLQWADNATINLLSFFVDKAQSSPIMIVGVYRSNEIDQMGLHPIRRLTNNFSRLYGYKEINLHRFSFQDISNYLRYSNHNFPEDSVTALLKLSGGNPLFIREYINRNRA